MGPHSFPIFLLRNCRTLQSPERAAACQQPHGILLPELCPSPSLPAPTPSRGTEERERQKGSQGVCMRGGGGRSPEAPPAKPPPPAHPTPAGQQSRLPNAGANTHNHHERSWCCTCQQLSISLTGRLSPGEGECLCPSCIRYTWPPSTQWPRFSRAASKGVYLRQQIGLCFLTFYFVLEYKRLTVL